METDTGFLRGKVKPVWSNFDIELYIKQISPFRDHILQNKIVAYPI